MTHTPPAEPTEGFTPGPWLAASGPSSIVGWPVVARNGSVICDVAWAGHAEARVNAADFAAYKARVAATAQLIARAPDLLAENARLRAALEKAASRLRECVLPPLGMQAREIIRIALQNKDADHG